MCLFSRSFLENACSQTSQTNGFTPEWHTKCLSRWYFVRNALAQKVQECGRSVLWVNLCLYRCCRLPKHLLHSSHTNRFSSLCTFFMWTSCSYLPKTNVTWKIFINKIVKSKGYLHEMHLNYIFFSLFNGLNCISLKRFTT